MEQETTFYRFLSEIRAFLSKLVKDPIKADVSKYLKERMFNKTKTINVLLKSEVLERHEKILDSFNSDEKEPKYVVKYKVRKKDFENRIYKIYIKYFEKNLPEKPENKKSVDECDCGGAIGGATSSDVCNMSAPTVPFGPIQRRSIGFVKKKKKSDNDILGKTITAEEKETVHYPRICYITEDQYRRLLLMEDKMTDTIKRYIRANNPFTEQQLATPVAELDPQMRDNLRQYEGAAFDTCVAQGFNLLAFLRLCFLKRFGIERGKGPSEYYLGLARIGLQELGMFTRTDTDNEITELRNIAAYMHSSEDPNVKNAYDSNFNGLPFKDLAAKIEPFMKRDLDNDRNRLMNANLGNSDYRIIPIRSYEEASQYGKYTSWCVTHGQGHFDSYTNGGNRFYFCLQNRFENVPEQVTENCPLDTYGLSMISVLVDTLGRPVHITTRWNHSHDGEDNPNLHTAQQFQELTHINFYNTFKPYTEEEQLAMGIIPFSRVQQLLDSGTPPRKIFNYIRRFSNGLAEVKLNGKWNFITPEGKLLSDTWFDTANEFFNGFAQVKLNDKWNFINTEGKLLSNVWFDETSYFSNGFARVILNGKWNFITPEGKLLSDTWFDETYYFSNGLARVILNGKWNFINTEGKLLSDVWFKAVGNFSNGFAQVMLNGKWNFINTEGKLLSDTWFDETYYFSNGLAEVKLNDKWFYLDTNGHLYNA